jgi:hypothetical protein
MKTKVLLITLFLATGIFSSVNAQQWTFSAGGVYAIPGDEFKERTENNGAGIQIGALRHLGNLPLSLGVTAGLIGYGEAQYFETIDDNQGGQINLRADVDNNGFNGLAVLRVHPLIGKFEPYAEAMYGFRYIYSNLDISNATSNIPVRQDSFSESVSTAGISLGLSYTLFEKEDRNTERMVKLKLNTNYTIHWSGDAEFVKQGTMERNITTVRYETERRNVSQSQFQFGLILQLF